MKEDKYKKDVYISLEEICRLVGIDFNTMFKEISEFMSSELVTPEDKKSVYLNKYLKIRVGSIGVVNVFPVSKYWVGISGDLRYVGGLQLLADTYEYKLSNYGKF